jgi:hypothetical protein
MSVEGQAFIAEVRAHLAKEDFQKAELLLRQAPVDRSGWRPQENDEVLALQEFIESLKYPEIA